MQSRMFILREEIGSCIVVQFVDIYMDASVGFDILGVLSGCYIRRIGKNIEKGKWLNVIIKQNEILGQCV